MRSNGNEEKDNIPLSTATNTDISTRAGNSNFTCEGKTKLCSNLEGVGSVMKQLNFRGQVSISLNFQGSSFNSFQFSGVKFKPRSGLSVVV